MSKCNSILFIFVFVISQFQIVLASETIKGAKKDAEIFKQEMSLKLESVEKQIQELKTKSKKKGNEIKDSTVKDLESTRDKLQSELNTIKEGSKENWKKLKHELSDSIDTLNSKLQKALKD